MICYVNKLNNGVEERPFSNDWLSFEHTVIESIHTPSNYNNIHALTITSMMIHAYITCDISTTTT